MNPHASKLRVLRLAWILPALIALALIAGPTHRLGSTSAAADTAPSVAIELRWFPEGATSALDMEASPELRSAE